MEGETVYVAQFNDSFPPIADGVANGVKNYALWLNRKYGKACVVVPEFPGYGDNEEFEVIRYKSIPYLTRKPYRIGLHNISFEAKKRLEELPLDIIHARSPFSSGAFAREIAREKGIPLVASFHSQYYYDIKDQIGSETLTRNILKKIAEFYESADAVWTVNERTAETLRNYGYRGSIDVIHNGTDFTMPEDYDNIRKKTGEDMQIGDDEFVFLYVGQLIWHKNLRLIVESLSEIKKSEIDFKMIFVGDGDAREELEELVKSKNIDDRVIFTGQINSRNRLRDIYVRADLFLFPSLYDTFGIVVREAAALNTPCILIKGSNAAQDIKDGYNGFLCENNVRSFSQAVAEITRDRELCRKTGENARETLPESWESIVDKAYSKYVDIIGNFKKKEKNAYKA
jgi:glycosyltransferase involved in cell wall biosynthesis